MLEMSETPAEPEVFDALIIGAGFSGLYQLHCLRDGLGLSAQVLEAAEGVGGTWYWNRYPGARCDSESHSYSYYFSDALLDGWEWTERYPQQPEILEYLNYCADQLHLRQDIRFATRVRSARYQEAHNRWMLETDNGKRFTATYLITAVGCLSTVNVPDIPGLESFEGEWYHTGEWPHEGVSFADKRVGQIGTGSTGIQAAPVIARTAGHLTVFQRTAQFSVPAHNHELTEHGKRYFREHRDEIRQTMHASPNGHPFLISQRRVFDVSAAQRDKIYEQAWAVGGLRFRGCFHDLLINKAANDTAVQFLKKKIRATVTDPETAEKLADIDHPYATKRPPIDTGYFETYNRPNVSLVDVRAAPIQRITPTGLETTQASYDLDVMVFATGFDAMTGPLLKIHIEGRNGQTLTQAWREGPKTYLGLQVAGFPNLFTITGPGSPSVLSNMPVAIEQHVEWITNCIAHLHERGLERIEATPQAMEAWVAHVNAAAHATLLPLAGHSWYLGANVPGKPQVFMPYAGGLVRYRRICDQVAAKGYEGFALGEEGKAVMDLTAVSAEVFAAADTVSPGV